ncbi:MAG TPA: pyridoxal phosphate-dependent aminotransferase, partial [Clostridiales bacterium]|nr:pyridoxal phosphate-dependent aminotransferase [Clostridiales bacterium]
ALLRAIETTEPTALHGYTTAAGDPAVRRAIADDLSARYGVEVDPTLLYLTVGAAAALSAVFGAVLSPGDEAIVISPYFPEYRVFLSHAGATVVEVTAKAPDFSLDLEKIGEAITDKTALLLYNSPNNPTGAVVSREELAALSDLLRAKEKEVGHPIYLVADEPYRELIYDGEEVPSPLAYYDDTVICYSFSKSLSLPGERIGYVLVSPRAAEAKALYEGVMGAARALGYVCAPSLFQKILPACLGKVSSLETYDRNRKKLYGALTSYGFTAVYPRGAFYLFLKSPEADATAFLARAKAHGILFVPSDSFGVPGYVRIAYCVSEKEIEDSLPAFRALAEEYGLN